MIARPPIVTISREKFRLTLWKLRLNRYRRVKVYPITVGKAGHETPVGLYFVQSKTRKPDWKAPDSDWVAPEDRGKVYLFGEEGNPFAGGFITLDPKMGIGIHGTSFDPALGTKASHGCIRMGVEDVIDLYRRLPEGAPVFIY